MGHHGATLGTALATDLCIFWMHRIPRLPEPIRHCKFGGFDQNMSSTILQVYIQMYVPYIAQHTHIHT